MKIRNEKFWEHWRDVACSSTRTATQDPVLPAPDFPELSDRFSCGHFSFFMPPKSKSPAPGRKRAATPPPEPEMEARPVSPPPVRNDFSTVLPPLTTVVPPVSLEDILLAVEVIEEAMIAPDPLQKRAKSSSPPHYLSETRSAASRRQSRRSELDRATLRSQSRPVTTRPAPAVDTSKPRLPVAVELHAVAEKQQAVRLLERTSYLRNPRHTASARAPFAASGISVDPIAEFGPSALTAQIDLAIADTRRQRQGTAKS
jgi:hypothetical protein